LPRSVEPSINISAFDVLDEWFHRGGVLDINHRSPAEHDVEHGVCAREAFAEYVTALQFRSDPAKAKRQAPGQTCLLSIAIEEEQGMNGFWISVDTKASICKCRVRQRLCVPELN
jgi:hypothetical protein